MRKIIIYSRVSTEKQTIEQQERTVNEWLAVHGMTATHRFADESVSGKTSYKDRKLGKEVLPILNIGDILIVAEISRLGRSMNDLNKLVIDELKPRGIRLVIVQMGIDLDCSNIKAIDEMLLFAFSFSAQLERELIQERTRSAIEVRKNKIKEDGKFVSKKGRVCTSLGRPKNTSVEKATTASAIARKEEAKEKPYNKAVWTCVRTCSNGFERLSKGVFEEVANMLNGMNVLTATGKPFTAERARSAYYNLRAIYTDYRPVRKDSAQGREMESHGIVRLEWRKNRTEYLNGK